ncbi:uncharacterized protein LOC143265013 isoform X1 [Megachile rotundata]|uniref:uncharacterized protein LOC143265013 isoform X1 n=1 Tax=Megachile rotundata TaxID=143995 RepID=UPI003FD505EC
MGPHEKGEGNKKAYRRFCGTSFTPLRLITLKHVTQITYLLSNVPPCFTGRVRKTTFAHTLPFGSSNEITDNSAVDNNDAQGEESNGRYNANPFSQDSVRTRFEFTVDKEAILSAAVGNATRSR